MMYNEFSNYMLVVKTMKYVEPEMKIIMFNSEDVVVASSLPGVTEPTTEIDDKGFIGGGEG